MKDFFANLIDRHQGRAETVVPRAHSYFEEGAGSLKPGSDDLSQTFSQGEQKHTIISSPAESTPESGQQESGTLLTHGQVANPRPLPLAIGDPGEVHPDLRERSDTTPGLLSDGNLVNPDSQVIPHPGPVELPPVSEYADDPVAGSGNATLPVAATTLDPNQRIGEMLRRLQHGLVSSDSTGLSETSDQRAEPMETKRESNQDQGELEIPAWLNQRQPELNLKSPEINADLEQVVNVTIGRIEIKAQGESKTKPGSPRQKPSGVMSLDEYLSKRQRKGVV